MHLNDGIIIYVCGMRPRDDQKIEAIFNATLKLSGSYGLAGLTMNKIAKEAKIAHGTLYVYFENKEVLLNELYKNIHKHGSFSKMGGIANLSLKEQLRFLWESSLKYRLNNPYIFTFASQFIISSFISPESQKLQNQFDGYFYKTIGKGKKEGIFKPVSDQILIAIIYGFIHELSVQLRRHNTKPTKKIIEDSFAVCWDAICIAAPAYGSRATS